MLHRMWLDEPAGVPVARSDTPAAGSVPPGAGSDTPETPTAVQSGSG